MKSFELRQLIKEEIRSVLNENRLKDLVDEFISSTDPDNEYYDYEICILKSGEFKKVKENTLVKEE